MTRMDMRPKMGPDDHAQGGHLMPQSPVAGPSGASLDIDDAAGETDQDRGEARGPCAPSGFSDGGSGSPARVDLGHSGRDWAAEIARSGIRIKEK